MVFSSFLHFPRATFHIFHPCVDFSPETLYLGIDWHEFFYQLLKFLSKPNFGPLLSNLMTDFAHFLDFAPTVVFSDPPFIKGI